MAEYFVYWKPSTVADDQDFPMIDHSASDQYDRLAVRDILWIVTSEGPNDLVLVGRQRVDRVVGQEEAERFCRNNNLWKAKYHVITDEPEEKAMLDISRYTDELEFDGGVEMLPDGFTGRNLQQMRRLTRDSVMLLESLWARRKEAVPKTLEE